MKTSLALGVMASTLLTSQAFIVPPLTHPSQVVAHRSGRGQALMVVPEDPMRNMMRSARKPGPNDRLVELKKPLGLVLEEDEKGNIYIKDIKPGSEAAKSGLIQKGDMLSMISATFGDEMWSARGAGLNMVMSAIQIRQGQYVKLVLEGSNESSQKAARASQAAVSRAKSAEEAKKKKDALLQELNADDQKLKKKKFLGLF